MSRKCECGFEPDKNDTRKHAKCSVTLALRNHITFPCLELVIDIFNPSKLYMKQNLDASLFSENPDLPRRHWALILQITKATENRNYKFEGFNSFNERLMFQLNDGVNNEPTTFKVDNIKRGYTAVCLYAYKYERSPSIVITSGKNFDHFYIFKASMERVLEEGSKVLNDWDLRAIDQAPVCFGCGNASEQLSRCVACKLAKYCSKDCQADSWKRCHKYLCNQMEVLLRLACLPRHLKFDHHFTFKLDEASALPPYIFNSNFVQIELPNSILNDSNCNMSSPMELQQTSDSLAGDQIKCGLCKKTNTESFDACGKQLIRTKCCQNWICDDSHEYVINSFKKTSCWRNHERYTQCGIHFKKGHKEEWQTCKQCEYDNKSDMVTYIDHASNEYNFEPRKDLSRIEIQCSNCDFWASELKYFSGRVISSRNDEYKFFCKRQKCKEIGFPCGYPYHETAFINMPKEMIGI